MEMELQIISVNSQQVNFNKNNNKHCNVQIREKTSQRSTKSKISTREFKKQEPIETSDQNIQVEENSCPRLFLSVFGILFLTQFLLYPL